MFFSVDLLSLLQWKEHPEMIQEALNLVLRLNGEELVKFLQDVLDALFSMFSTEDGNSTTHSGLVFHVLVSQSNVCRLSRLGEKVDLGHIIEFFQFQYPKSIHVKNSDKFYPFYIAFT
jgi:hypothetical protein